MIITKENIKGALEENKIMLIQFWAPWCAPCRGLTPTIDALEEEYKDAIGRVNTDDNPILSKDFGIRGIPALIMFKDGKEVERFGGNSKSFFTEKLNYYLNAVT
jgi:thioredoxin 1